METGIFVGGRDFGSHFSRSTDCLMDRNEVHVTTFIADRITVNPKQCGGRPCIRGMRIRVVDILELMGAGLSASEIVEELPDLEAEDIRAAIKFATQQIDHPVLVPA